MSIEKVEIKDEEIYLILGSDSIFEINIGKFKVSLCKETDESYTFGNYVEYIPSFKVHLVSYFLKYSFEVYLDLTNKE